MGRRKNSNDILTPNLNLKIGQVVCRGGELVAYIKRDGKADIFSLSDFAEALYGNGTQCIVIPPKGGRENVITKKP